MSEPRESAGWSFFGNVNAEANRLGKAGAIRVPLYLGRLAASLEQARQHVADATEMSLGVTTGLQGAVEGIGHILSGTQNPQAKAAMLEAANAAAASSRVDELNSAIKEGIRELEDMVTAARAASEDAAQHTWNAQAALQGYAGDIGGSPPQQA